MSRNYARRYASDYHIFRTIFFFSFLFLIVKPILKLYYNIKVKGKENLPKSNNIILAGNHVSELDPPMLAWAVNRPIAFMAKKELFGNDKRSWLIKRLGAFAVDRNKPELATFKTVKDIFKTNWALGIFPEGGTRPEHTLEDIHKGFVVIAKKCEADIVPFAVCGFDGYAKKMFEKNITVKILKPISHELPTEEILKQWCEQVCEATGFKNLTESNF